MNPTIILLILAALLGAWLVIHFALHPPGEKRKTHQIANSGHLATYGGRESRVFDVAVARRFLVVRKGTANNSVAIGTVADEPLGIGLDVVEESGLGGVQLLGSGSGTCVVVANAAIAAGARVYAAADGKVAPTGVWLVGKTTNTPATADGDEIPIDFHAPRLEAPATGTITVVATGAQTVTPNFAAGKFQAFSLDLTNAPITLAAPTNLPIGQSMEIFVPNPGTGTHVLTAYVINTEGVAAITAAKAALLTITRVATATFHLRIGQAP